MGSIHIDYNKCDLCEVCLETCPFNAMEIVDSKVVINAACKVCRLCIKSCPNDAISFVERKRQEIDKALWRGVMVYVEHFMGQIHPVTYELIGVARKLAEKINHPVYCLFVGHDIEDRAQQLLYYGVDKVFVYDKEEFRQFRVDIYTNVFEDVINRLRPSIVLIGGTTNGRSLAPRVATRFRTGLTADCTKLDVKGNTDLVQIRPAFGGNIMAQIVTPNSRPQFATVRYKVMEEAKGNTPHGKVQLMDVDDIVLKSI